MISVFFNIIIKSLKADKTFYKDDNNFNEAAIYFALIIMLIVSIISIIPNSVFLEFFSAGFNIGSIKGPNLRSIIIGAAIIWTIKTVYLYFIGTVLFPMLYFIYLYFTRKDQIIYWDILYCTFILFIILLFKYFYINFNILQSQNLSSNNIVNGIY